MVENKSIAEQIKEAEDSEGAEKKRNQAIIDAVNKAGKAQLADLIDKFIVIKGVTDYGDLFAPEGDLPLILAIKADGVYKLDIAHDKLEDQIADPTKGKLVVELDSANNQINWLQDHVEQQPFESFNSLHSSKYLGDDAGQPLLDAIQDYIRGTFNISGYDSRLVSKAELVADLVGNAPASSATQPTSSATQPASSAAQPASSAAQSVSKAKASSSSNSATSGASIGGSRAKSGNE